MRYAGGRPLYQLSLSLHDPRDPKPVPVLRWSPTVWRKMEALRDKIMRNCGTDEPWFMDDELKAEHPFWDVVTAQWRKPLRIDEVAQMAPTPEVRERQGRP